MQYSHGTCADTARPISSFVLPSSLVAGLSWNWVRPAHQDDKSVAGTLLKKSGTKPNVFWISAVVAAAGDAGAEPARFSADARPNSEAVRTSERTVFFIGISLVLGLKTKALPSVERIVRT